MLYQPLNIEKIVLIVSLDRTEISACMVLSNACIFTHIFLSLTIEKITEIIILLLENRELIWLIQ